MISHNFQLDHSGHCDEAKLEAAQRQPVYQYWMYMLHIQCGSYAQWSAE